MREAKFLRWRKPQRSKWTRELVCSSEHARAVQGVCAQDGRAVKVWTRDHLKSRDRVDPRVAETDLSLGKRARQRRERCDLDLGSRGRMAIGRPYVAILIPLEAYITTQSSHIR
eukprot:3007626-Pleurochrysis_carterae.AAC.1